MRDLTLYAYIADTACTKCGGNDISDSYHEGTEFPSGCPSGMSNICWTSTLPEHIRRYCRRCSYQWLAAPINSAKNQHFEGRPADEASEK